MRIPELHGIGNRRRAAPGRHHDPRPRSTESPLVREPLPRARRRRWASISAPVLRNMGTIGGNVCLDTRCTYLQPERGVAALDRLLHEGRGHRSAGWRPGSARCWAISASDSAPMLCALDARVRLVSSRGERMLPLTALYRDDGIDYLTKRPDEIVAEILVPAGVGCRPLPRRLPEAAPAGLDRLRRAHRGGGGVDRRRRPGRARPHLPRARSIPCPRRPSRRPRPWSAGRSPRRPSPRPPRLAAPPRRRSTTPISRPSGAAPWSSASRRGP